MPGVKKRHNDSSINALVAAAEGGDILSLRQLLDVVGPNSQTVSGNTALRAATALGDVDCICALLDYGANVNQETSRGTALLAASAQGDTDIISLLLDKGADVDHETASGTTALCAAIMQHKHAAVLLLLQRGAQTDHANKDSMTPVQLAQGAQDMQMLALLQQAQVQHAATGALKDLDTRADKLEAEIGKQQDQGLQEVQEQMLDSKQALASKLAELRAQNDSLRKRFVTS